MSVLGLIETPALHPAFLIDDKVLSKCPQTSLSVSYTHLRAHETQ